MNQSPLRQSFPKNVSPDEAFDSKMNAELLSRVFSALKFHKTESNTIEMICIHTGWSWQKATSYLKFVQTKHKEELARAQTRRVFFYGAGTSIIGLLHLWLSLSTWVWWLELQSFVEFPNGIACPICLNAQPFYEWLAQSNQYAPSTETPDAIVAFFFIYCAPVVGFGMFVGGITGIIRSWVDLINSRRQKS